MMQDEGNGDILEDFMSKLTGDMFTMPTRTIPSHPSKQDIQPSQSSSQFADRKKTNVVDEQLHGHLPLRNLPAEAGARATVTMIQEPIERYRYMFENIREKGESLDDRIDYIADVIDQHYALNSAYSNPTRSNQSTIVAVGRICSDATEGKLNDKSVSLETSRAIGMGRRVKLDLGKVDEYALFPGQIVAVKGINNTGNYFTVHEFLMPPLPPVYTHDERRPASNKITEVIVARGPYTLDGDLAYQPLDELVTMCAHQKPHALLMMGPFVSSSHPQVANGTLHSLPEDIFRDQVATRLNSLAAKCRDMHILLIPHADDIIHEYPLFPQPSFTGKELGLQEPIQCLSNPATFEIDGCVFAVSNTEMVAHLGREELAKSKTQADRLGRLAKHMLQQQTLYPLFPPAPGDNLDSEHMPDIQISKTPDVLVLPSQLKHFAKAIEDTVYLNPGFLAKQQAGGTYARLVFCQGEEKMCDRIRVDMIKL